MSWKRGILVLGLILAEDAMAEGSVGLLDFGADVDAVLVHDGVMGGVSTGHLERGDATTTFLGELSLENDGGFASVRFANPRPDLSAFEGLAIRVRGDGRRYQLRLRDDRSFGGIAWRREFDTADGEWIELRMDFTEFVPGFRGREVEGAGPLRTDRLQQIGILLADKRPGPFRIELDWIRAFAPAADQGSAD